MNPSCHPAVHIFRSAHDPAIGLWAQTLSANADHRVPAIRVNENPAGSEEDLKITLGMLLALLPLDTVMPPVYLRQWPAGDWPLELHTATADLIGPGCAPLLNTMHLWMGTSGASTPTHADDTDNALFQILGRKRIRLWPPETNFSQGPPLGGEQKFPHYTLTLGPGEVLFLPANWAHHVTTLDGAVSLNGWHKDAQTLLNRQFS